MKICIFEHFTFPDTDSKLISSNEMDSVGETAAYSHTDRNKTTSLHTFKYNIYNMLPYYTGYRV